MARRAPSLTSTERHTSVMHEQSHLPLLTRLASKLPNAITPIQSHGSPLSETLGLQGYKTWLNYLLVFMVIGIVSHLNELSSIVTFVSTFIGMIPLATLLGKASEDVAEHTNQTVGALINVTFGNAVELILSISAMRADRVELLQGTIVGSILSNLLLVLGSSFFVGGIMYKEQEVLRAVSENNANMLLFAVFGFSIPALFDASVPQELRTEDSLGRLSLVTAIILLSMYCMFLFFQLHTHADLYQRSSNVLDDDGSDEQDPPASQAAALTILCFTVILVTISSEILVLSLDDFSRQIGLSQKFIAIILLPIVANAVEQG